MSEPDLKIESGVPVPKRASHSRYRDLSDAMRYGDSVVLETARERDSLAAAINRQSGAKSVSRKLSTGEFRVWKVKREGDK